MKAFKSKQNAEEVYRLALTVRALQAMRYSPWVLASKGLDPKTKKGYLRINRGINRTIKWLETLAGFKVKL